MSYSKQNNQNSTFDFEMSATQNRFNGITGSAHTQNGGPVLPFIQGQSLRHGGVKHTCFTLIELLVSTVISLLHFSTQKSGIDNLASYWR